MHQLSRFFQFLGFRLLHSWYVLCLFVSRSDFLWMSVIVSYLKVIYAMRYVLPWKKFDTKYPFFCVVLLYNKIARHLSSKLEFVGFHLTVNMSRTRHVSSKTRDIGKGKKPAKERSLKKLKSYDFKMYKRIDTIRDLIFMYRWYQIKWENIITECKT